MIQLRANLITLTRDCDAKLIPSATPVTLRRGEAVMLTQALGGSYTVELHGNLVRIENKDADALGFTVEELPIAMYSNESGIVDEEQVWAVLATCYDPEIPVNITELGLVYRCEVVHQEGTNHIIIEMTLTAPGCSMGPVMMSEIDQKLKKIPGVTSTDIQLVFDPPWNQALMSEAAKLQLGML
ncbi:MAG TPA: putative Fe-S cluster assembly protein SufT [Gammaproteobacteria bacterium]|nr:putative Fe-S cluster assembly protein SufT [Gammaproteobacteria bacterium]